ncbi:hypothetical protein SEA_BUNKER_41 [Gordonia phage Bunker]|nr:hypothetical protein SEA_BUNKER_41 [Gordonia phage Bunker]
MGEEAAGGTNPHGAGGRGVAVVDSPISQSLPDLDTADLLEVCDLDVDAVVGWQVWQALRTEAIATAAISAVTQLLRWVGAPPPEADLTELSHHSPLRGS